MTSGGTEIINILAACTPPNLTAQKQKQQKKTNNTKLMSVVVPQPLARQQVFSMSNIKTPESSKN